MKPLTAIRKRRRPLVVHVLAMLGAVWLNMVLQPCLMAAEMDMDMTGPCPHCPQPMTDECAGAASNVCTYFDRVDYDARGPHSKLATKADFTCIALAAPPPACLHTAGVCATGPPRDPAPHLPRAPINVLNCVYLN